MTAVAELDEVVDALRGWQHERAPMQLHLGDIGWFWRFGAEAVAAALRVWRRDGRILAIGFLDGPETLRLAIAPDHQHDEELARRVAADLSGSDSASVAAVTSVEIAEGISVRDLLAANGWGVGEAWTQLRHGLAETEEKPPLRIEAVAASDAGDRASVQRASFENSTFTEQHWREMAAGPAYAEARCLVGYDDGGEAVAAVTVWSSGAGKPGLIEPLGVNREHRRRGYGRAITLAAVGTLRELGSSSAIVATPSANVGAVATYLAAGFEQRGEVRDLTRPRMR